MNNLHPSLCILKTQTSGPLLRCNELGFLGICTSISCPNGCCAPQVSTTQKRFRKKVDQDGNYLEKFISSEYFYKDSPEANLSCASTMKNYRNSFIYRLSFHLEKIYTRFSFNMSYSVPILLESGYTAYKKRQWGNKALFILLKSMCSSHFIVWLHLSFHKNKSKHVHKERAAH